MKKLSLLLVALMTTVAAAQTYDEAGLKAFRAEREKVLLADNGWFTVAGLHFLNPGENKFGSDPLNDIVLEFPDMDAARGWYRSAPYQAIVWLRTDNSQGDTVLVEGVAEGHRATDVLPALKLYA